MKNDEDENNLFSIDDLYEILRTEIINLKFSPGTKLSENTLCSRFNISRTPARAILSRLQASDLVNIIPKKGSFISLIDLDAAEQMIFMRIQVEKACMKYIAKHEDARLIDLLKKNLEQQKKLIQNANIEKFYEMDSEFHRLCLLSCEKGRLWQLIQENNIHYSRYRALDYHTNRRIHLLETLYSQHSHLLELMQMGKEDDIDRAITEHLYGGFLRMHKEFSGEYSSFINKDGRTLKQIILGIKLLINETK